MKHSIKLLALLCTSAPAWAAEEVKILPEINVTAKTDELTESRESNSQKVIVTRKEIENMSVMTISDVVGKLPGVEVKGDSQRARGMSRDSVAILIDGERQSSQVIFGALGRLPSGDLEKVEILRGSSAEFGGSASVTVNLVMKKTLPKRSTEMRVALTARDKEPGYSLSWTENGGEGGFSWSLPVNLVFYTTPTNTQLDRQHSLSGTRDLWQKENTYATAKMGHHGITPRLSWRKNRDVITVSPMIFLGPVDRDTKADFTAYANPAAGTGLSFNGDRSTKETGGSRIMRVRVEGEKYRDDVKLSGRMSLNNAKRTLDTTRNVHDALNVLTTSVDSTVSTDNELNSALRWDQPFGVNYVSVGTEYIKLIRDDKQNFSGTETRYASSTRDGILWVQNDWTPQSTYTLTSGLRMESTALYSDAVSKLHTAWLPSIAVRWEPKEKWVMRTSLGGGLKMPKLDEISDAAVLSLAANTPTEPDKRGNPNIRPERSVNFEAVLEKYLAEDAGMVSGNLYVRSTQDFTERRVQKEGVRWIDRPFNEGEALHWGWELDGKLKTDSLGWKGATVKAHLTLPNADVKDTRLGITRMARDTPIYTMSAGLDGSVTDWKSSYGLSMQLSGRSTTDIPGEQLSYTQSRTTVDGFWLYKLNDKFKLRLAGQNLFDADTVRETLYTASPDAWKLSVVDGGYRTVTATLEGRW